MTDHSTSAPAEHRLSHADTDTAAVRSVYEMRSLRTDAERAEAVALVEDRLGWLTRHGLPKPAGADIPELFWSKELRTVGLFEDGLLLACMILGLEAGSRREGSAETGPRLLLHHVYTLPEHPDDIVRLITLWSSDYAARLDRPGVRAETYAPREPNTGPTRRFLDRLQEMGWTVTGTAALFGEHVIRLELRAEARPPLLLLIRCEVPLPLPASSDSKGRTS